MLNCWQVKSLRMSSERRKICQGLFSGADESAGMVGHIWLWFSLFVQKSRRSGLKGIVGSVGNECQLYITFNSLYHVTKLLNVKLFFSLTCCDRAWLHVSVMNVSFLTSMFCILQMNCFILYSELSYTYFCNKVLTWTCWQLSFFFCRFELEIFINSNYEILMWKTSISDGSTGCQLCRENKNELKDTE